jgi:anti-anti-sigma factor
MRQSRLVSRLTSFGQPLEAARLTVSGIGVAYTTTGGIMSTMPVENALMSTRPIEKMLAAPERLDLESRTAFRRAAGEVLDLLAEGAGRLVIDLSGTRSVDSAGLGALMLIQRRAAERRQTVCLRGANEELRFLLVLTKLDDLFELETGVS